MSSITENRSALKTFLSSIASIKGDLSNITAPPFVLATKSAVEFPASWAEHPSILIAPALEEDPQKRALLVLKWYLVSLKRQQYSGGSEADGVKKPLNAFLGELFIAQFEDESGVAKLISEQVSHHPPVTACYLFHKSAGVRAEGYTAQEITLSKTFTVKVNQIGHAIVHLDRFQEAYLVTLPTLTVKGLLTGTPYPELSGDSYITSSTGYTAKIEYEGKGWWSGKKNSFRASLYRTVAPERVIYKVEGQWNDKFSFTDEEGKEMEVYDTNRDKAAAMQINNLEEQDSWESRRAWQHVIAAIRVGDFKIVGGEKGKIEVAQRALRKSEEKEGRGWEQAMFRTVDEDPVFDVLAERIGLKEDQSKTKGIWKFDPDKAGRAQKPYHGDLTPLG